MVKTSTKSAFWIAVYLLLILSPLIVLLLAPRPEGREFWRELSVALGFAGLSLIGLQFVPTARLPFLANVFPLDKLYFFHHHISLIGFALALAHPILLFLNNPYTVRLLNVLTAPWRARAAVAAVIGLLILVASSVWRKQLEISYEAWRTLHDAMAIAIAGAALYHILNVNYYTAHPVQRTLWIVLACIWGALILYVRLVKPLMMLRRPYRVVEVVPERGETWTLAIEPEGHHTLTFLPGQVAWLTMRTSPFSIREHPFSFSSSAERPQRIEFAIRELGDMTSTIKDLEPGERIYIDGPYGTFDIDQHEAPGYVFLAGGIGVVPIMSMLRTMADRGDERSLVLFYGSRTLEGVTFYKELQTLQERLNLTVICALERPPEGWTGEIGFINADMLKRHMPEGYKDWVCFVCGPLPMIDAVEGALAELDVLPSHVYSEQYEMA